jgi:hypothetical protein
METKEYKLLDGRTIRAKYDRLGMCKISKENLEAFVKEFNTSYRQGKILEKIKENYALMKLDARKKGKPIYDIDSQDWEFNRPIKCPFCNERLDYSNHYCHSCGAEMEMEEE